MTTMGTITENHYDNGSNLTHGSKRGNDEILADTVRAARVDVVALEGRMDVVELSVYDVYPKQACRVVTVATLPGYVASGSKSTKKLTAAGVGILTIDGVATVLNDRILVNNQGTATGADRGLYYVSTEGTAGVAFVLTRTTDANANVEVTAGISVRISEGTAQADSRWVLVTNDPIDLDVTALSFRKYAGPNTTDTRHVYVNGNVPVTGDGTELNPYKTIQEGVNAAETLVPTAANPVDVHIKSDIYTEQVVVHQPGVNLLADPNTTLTHGAGRPLTFTNMTPAALAIWYGGGAYPLAVANQGDSGPTDCVIENLLVTTSVAARNAVNLLGCMGDSGATTTGFGARILFRNCQLVSSGGGGGLSLYARNCVSVVTEATSEQDVTIFNVASYSEILTSHIGAFTAAYDGADANGTPDGGYVQTIIFGLLVTGKITANAGATIFLDEVTHTGELETNGTGSARVRGGLNVGTVDGNGTGTLTTTNMVLTGAADLEGTVTATLNGGKCLSTFTAAAGVGVVTLNGVEVLGAITDASLKIIRSNEFRDLGAVCVIDIEQAGFPVAGQLLTIGADIYEADGAGVNLNFVIGAAEATMDNLLARAVASGTEHFTWDKIDATHLRLRSATGPQGTVVAENPAVAISYNLANYVLSTGTPGNSNTQGGRTRGTKTESRCTLTLLAAHATNGQARFAFPFTPTGFTVDCRRAAGPVFVPTTDSFAIANTNVLATLAGGGGNLAAGDVVTVTAWV